MKWSWICAVISVCLIQVHTAPRNRRWIPERYSDDDHGMDNGYVPSGPSYDVPGSHNSLQQNYMSYYWPDYYNNRRDSSDDYAGLMYRANDNSQYVMSDPVQQLYDVQSYSYAQTMPIYYPQMNPVHGYGVGGRAHGAEGHVENSPRAIIKIATGHSDSENHVSSSSSPLQLRPSLLTAHNNHDGPATTKIVLADQSTHFPLHLSSAVASVGPQHHMSFSPNDEQQSVVFAQVSHPDHTDMNSFLSSSSVFESRTPNLVMMKTLSPSSHLTKHDSSSTQQFVLVQHPTDSSTQQQMVLVPHPSATTAFGHPIFVMQQQPSTSASKTNSFTSGDQQQHFVILQVMNPNHQEKEQSVETDSVVLVQQQSPKLKKVGHSTSSSSNHRKVSSSSSKTQTDAKTLVDVVVDTISSDHTKSKSKVSHADVITENKQLKSENNDEVLSEAVDVLQINDKVVNEQHQEEVDFLAVDVKEQEIDDQREALNTAEVAEQKIVAVEEQEIVAEDSTEFVKSDIEEVVAEEVSQSSSSSVLEDNEETDKALIQLTEIESEEAQARAMEPADATKFNYPEPVLTSPVDMVYPGVFVPSKPYSPSYYQPQYPTASYVQPVPYYGTSSLLSAPQQYPPPYLSYGQIMQPNKYISSSQSAPTAYYATYPAQNINIPAYSSSYNSQPRQSRHAMVSQSSLARNAYGTHNTHQ